MYAYRFTKTYNDCLKGYENNPEAKAALHDALTALAEDPFRHPRLGTHRVNRAQGKTFTSSVGGKGQRLIWRMVGKTIVLLLFGEHDAVYRRAENLRLEVDDHTETLRVIDADPGTGEARPYGVLREQVGTLFMAWSNSELADYGFEEHEIAVLRRLDTDAELLELEERMQPEAFVRALRLVMYGHPEGEVAARRAQEERERSDAAAEPQEDEIQEATLARMLLEPSANTEFASVEPEALRDILSKPIEDWMVFLHPDQSLLVARRYSGSARVRGAAGTGKTVVGLHRALSVARRSEAPVLFTTFVRNLPTVFGNLFARLEPSMRSRVEFSNLHRWARAYLGRAGRSVHIDTEQTDSIFDEAFRSFETELPLTRRYYREEIDWVIKGRELETLDQYLALERTGRGTPLSEAHRRIVWRLYEGYQGRMEWDGFADFNDLLAQAANVVRERGLARPYSTVIVDEAQDFTQVAIRLIRAICGSRPESLLLLADGQQAVYPGGYNLKTAGVDIVGRSSVLRVNYRNTAEIMGVARAIADGHEVPDSEGEQAEDVQLEMLRRGLRPARVGYSTPSAHDDALLASIERLIGSGSVGPGEIAVLGASRRWVRHFRRLIEEHNNSTQNLASYEGKPNPHIKVGTFQRAKGLEFKAIFLPRLDSEALGLKQRSGEDAAEFRERTDLLRRQVYVAVTRARDRLWIGWVGQPCEVIGPAVTAFGSTEPIT